MVLRLRTRALGAVRLLAGGALALVAAGALAQPPVGHALEVTLEPAAGRIAARDRVTLPAGAPARFALNAALDVRVEEPGAKLAPLDAPADTKHLRYYALTLPPGAHRATLRYEGRLNIGTAGSESSNVISDAGVFLDDTSGWYPLFGDRLVRPALTVHLPAGWDAVSQGKRGAETRTAGTVTVRWEERAPQQAIHLVAARFQRYAAPLPNGGEALVYLRTPDRKLADTYLAATRRYVEFYGRLLGPYPYAKFALVEHFRQTGLGMPSFTLLGSRVIRLPFIPETSYPHEILHNWWGNGVYVDPASGNWSEGLTTYLADYLKAEETGRGDAYRRDALARYAFYARGMHDFALAGFQARHDEVTQGVGYSKGLMLFHMLRRRLGDAYFLAGLRAFYARERFRRAGFDALRTAMEQASGQKLSGFFDQWVAGIGAPRLALENVSVRISDGHHHVRGTLRQTQRVGDYQLDVPLVLELADQPPFETTLFMSTRTLHFDIEVKGRPLRVAVDPRFDLIRRPAPEELPASLRDALDAERLTLVLPADAPAPLATAYRALAKSWQRHGVTVVRDDELTALPADGAVWLLGWDNRWRTAATQNADEMKFEDDGVTLAVARYARRAHSVALAWRHDGRSFAWLGADEPDSVARLARVLPRYHAMSYVVFGNDAATRPITGQWEVARSPLQAALTPESLGPLKQPARPALGAAGVAPGK